MISSPIDNPNCLLLLIVHPEGNYRLQIDYVFYEKTLTNFEENETNAYCRISQRNRAI